MDEASIVMIVAGAALLITRGSLLVAPNMVRILYLQSLLAPVVVRLSGLVWAAIGVAGWFYLQSDRGVIADNTEIVLYAFIGWQVLIKVILGGPYAKVMKDLWGESTDGAMRVIGLVFAAIGGALIYYGYLFG